MWLSRVAEKVKLSMLEEESLRDMKIHSASISYLFFSTAFSVAGGQNMPFQRSLTAG